MSLATFRARIPAINSWLLAGVCASIPLTVAPAYWLTAVMLLLWLAEGRFVAKFRALADEPLVWICLAYYGVFVASLFWSEDLEWGRRMLGRQNFFLLAPLYFSVARREHVGRYISAFLASVAFCEALALYNWAQMHVWPGLPDGIRVDKGADDTAPFVDRILYTPALALAGYLVGHRLLFDSSGTKMRLVYAGLLATTAFNLVISGGRAGLVGFLALLTLLAFQRFARRPVLAAAVSALLVGGIVIGGYAGNDYFRMRADRVVNELEHYEELPKASVSQRLVYWQNALRIFRDAPLAGVGIGDYPEVYRAVNERYTPAWAPAWNPHNHYLYVLTSTGLLGGVLLVALLGVPLLRRGHDDSRRRMRRALPLLFIVICLFESYLMRSNTSLMYVVFLALLWSPVRESRA